VYNLMCLMFQFSPPQSIVSEPMRRMNSMSPSAFRPPYDIICDLFLFYDVFLYRQGYHSARPQESYFNDINRFIYDMFYDMFYDICDVIYDL